MPAAHCAGDCTRNGSTDVEIGVLRAERTFVDSCKVLAPGCFSFHLNAYNLTENTLIVIGRMGSFLL